jgi:hypothetical protein
MGADNQVTPYRFYTSEKTAYPRRRYGKVKAIIRYDV